MEKKSTPPPTRWELISSLKTLGELLERLSDEEVSRLIGRTKQPLPRAAKSAIQVEELEILGKAIAEARNTELAEKILMEHPVFSTKDALLLLAKHFHIAVMKKDKNESIIAKIVRRLHGGPEGREAI